MSPRCGEAVSFPYRGYGGGERGYPKEAWLAAFTVFAINIAIVIGPTPPGTGVIALAFFDTSSNATSPTSR